jgi:hypothetical protein
MSLRALHASSHDLALEVDRLGVPSPTPTSRVRADVEAAAVSDTRPPSVVARPSVCRSGETGTPVALSFSARHHRIVDSARRQLELPVPKELIDAIAERVVTSSSIASPIDPAAPGLARGCIQPK